MTKQQLEDKYFHDFLVWCSVPSKGFSGSELIFWLDHNSPDEDNFWEWLAKCKSEVLKAES